MWVVRPPTPPGFGSYHASTDSSCFFTADKWCCNITTRHDIWLSWHLLLIILLTLYWITLIYFFTTHTHTYWYFQRSTLVVLLTFSFSFLCRSVHCRVSGLLSWSCSKGLDVPWLIPSRSSKTVRPFPGVVLVFQGEVIRVSPDHGVPRRIPFRVDLSRSRTVILRGLLRYSWCRRLPLTSRDLLPQLSFINRDKSYKYTIRKIPFVHTENISLFFLTFFILFEAIFDGERKEKDILIYLVESYC